MAHSQKRPPKSVLVRLCKQNYSHRGLSKIFKVSASTIGWWLKQYNLQTVQGSNTFRIRKPHCQYCGTKNGKNFYYGRKSCCRKCWSKKQNAAFAPRRKERRIALKYAAVQAKGGCCQKCGYRKNLAALQFHHPNREHKHENWRRLFGQIANSSKHIKTLAAQLDKCELLCANCHAAEHNPDTAMPICMSGNMLTFLSNWVIEFRRFFH